LRKLSAIYGEDEVVGKVSGLERLCIKAGVRSQNSEVRKKEF
jgi:hypothetical protein